MRTRSAKKRTLLREALAPGFHTRVWPQPKEAGWAKVPRTLSVVMQVVRENSERGADASGAYLDLLTRNMGEGLVEIVNETEHALLSGLSPSQRGARSWRDRVRQLARIGLVHAFPGDGPRINHVVLIHPREAIGQLRASGRVSDELWQLYQRISIDFGSESETSPSSVSSETGVPP